MASPRIAIIIPVHNRADLATAVLRVLPETVRDVGSLVVSVIDDGSEPALHDHLAALDPAFHVVRQEDNLGFAATINRAVAATDAPLCCLLNSDLVLAPGWLEPMLAVMESEPAAFAVGNVQTSVTDGSIDHAGIVFHEEGHPIHFRAAPDFITSRDHREFPAVTAACMLVRRERFLALGGFDESYRNGFEDVDLCLRARMRGWPTFVANRSRVGHHISASPGRKDHEDANARLFLGRWRPLTRVWQRDWDNRLLIERRRLAGEPAVSPSPPSIITLPRSKRILVDLAHPEFVEDNRDTQALIRAMLAAVRERMPDAFTFVWVVRGPTAAAALHAAGSRDEVWVVPGVDAPALPTDGRLRSAPCADARLARVLDVDAILCPHGVSTLLTPDIPVVAVASDVLHRDLPAGLRLAGVVARDAGFDRMVRTSFRILSASRWVADRLRHHYGVRDEQVLLLCGSARGDRDSDPRPHRAEHMPSCFLHPAGAQLHENHDTLLVAYRLYLESSGETAWPLVLTGPRDEAMERLAAHACALGIRSHVHLTGDPDDPLLTTPWSRAGALVYPSLHDGVGLALLEAMRAGVPVVAGAHGAILEIAGDAAHYVDVRDPRALAGGLARISTDATLRARLVDAGRARAQAFRLSAEAAKLACVLSEATETFRAAGITWRWDGGRP